MDTRQCTLEALRCILHPKSSREVRIESEQFIAKLKESQEFSMVLMSLLSVDGFEEGVYVLMLTLLHDWIRMWWSKIPMESQVEIRTILSHLVSQCNSRTYGGNYNSKLASILAEIAERQFPQHWTSMIEDFMTLWREAGFNVQEIIVKTLQYIYSDCTDIDFTNQLPSTRRQEIVAGLKIYQNYILNISFQYLLSNLNAVKDPSLEFTEGIFYCLIFTYYFSVLFVWFV
jgi:hypothetical protein